MAQTAARYDGHADWYDQSFSSFHPPAEELAFLCRALGTGGSRPCLDIACGTGLCAAALADAGYRAIGFDISADQLRFARRRMGTAIQADACALPVRNGSVPAAVGLFFHTDTEDFAAVLREVARCLAPGGRFIYAGLHPCFIGPFVDRTAESANELLQFSTGYGRAGWTSRASGDGSGIGGHVGFHHKTLTGFLGAFTDSGLLLRTVQEFSGGGVVLPRNIGIIAEAA